jgi:hypothetical protein
MRFLAFACLIVSVPFFNSSLVAETFDFDGQAVVGCVCPSPSRAGNCGNAGRQDWTYNVDIAVKTQLSVDLNEICFRKRDTTLCCPDRSSTFKGTLIKKCPGKSSC